MGFPVKNDWSTNKCMNIPDHAVYQNQVTAVWSQWGIPQDLALWSTTWGSVCEGCQSPTFPHEEIELIQHIWLDAIHREDRVWRY